MSRLDGKQLLLAEGGCVESNTCSTHEVELSAKKLLVSVQVKRTIIRLATNERASLHGASIRKAALGDMPFRCSTFSAMGSA